MPIVEHGVGDNDVSGRATAPTETIVNTILSELIVLVRPNHSNDNTCERDLGLIIDGMIIDIRNSTNANSPIANPLKDIRTPRAKARITSANRNTCGSTKAKQYVNNVVLNIDLKRQSKLFTVSQQD